MDKVYKIIPSVNFHTGVQALMLLFQVVNTRWDLIKILPGIQLGKIRSKCKIKLYIGEAKL